MIAIPNSLARLGSKASTFLIKHGPKIMTIGGAGMALAGTVMACEATLRADEVLDAHKARMEAIEAARALSLARAADSDIDAEEVYTEKDMKRDKFVAYLETGVGFAKLYGPAFAMSVGGVGLMEAAFVITERRRASAVAALTTLDTMFNEYKARIAAGEPIDILPSETQTISLPGPEEPEEQDRIVLDTEGRCDPFTFIFDETCDGWGGRGAFLINERVLTAPIDSWNYALGSRVDHVWMNDVLKSWGDVKDLDGHHVGEGTDFGHFYGWCEGDKILYDIKPYLVVFNDSNQFPMYVETSREEITALEQADVQTGYCYMITLKSSREGYDRPISPRNICNEVYGC